MTGLHTTHHLLDDTQASHNLCRKSEIVATRNIACGEEVTISYFGSDFGGLSTPRRAQLFQAQHLWPLPPPPYGPHADALAACPRADVDRAKDASASADMRVNAEVEERLEQASAQCEV